MYKYDKIDDESILLDEGYKRLPRRSTRKNIIQEVLNKENSYESFKNNKKITFLEVILMIFTCNIYKYE